MPVEQILLEVEDMSNTITVTFTDPTFADKALERLESLHNTQRINLIGAIVVLKDASGNVTISKARRFAAESGAADEDGVSGPVINTMISGHFGGSLMGNQAGALAGMSPDLRISQEQAEVVADRMGSNTSALLFEYTDGQSAFIAAIIRDLAGRPYAVDITDETKSDLETALRGVNPT